MMAVRIEGATYNLCDFIIGEIRYLSRDGMSGSFSIIHYHIHCVKSGLLGQVACLSRLLIQVAPVTTTTTPHKIMMYMYQRGLKRSFWSVSA